VLCRKGKHTASGQLVREINEWANERGDRHLMARSHRLLSVFFDFIGDVPSAWEHAVPAVELLDDTMSERMRADHLFGLGQVLVRTGAWDAARERYRTALQLADGLDDVPLRVKILNNLAWLEDDAEPNADMWAAPGETREQITGLYRRAWAHSDATIGALTLDTIGHVPWWPASRSEVTLHKILVHMIAETDRHAGQADIVRELIDGAVGLREGNDNMAPGDKAWWEGYRSRLEGAARKAGQIAAREAG